MVIDLVFELGVQLHKQQAAERSIAYKRSLHLIPDDVEYDTLNAIRGELASTPGVSDLMSLAGAEGVSFSDEWLDRKQDILHIDYGLKPTDISRMRVPEFAAKLIELRALELSRNAGGQANKPEVVSPKKSQKPPGRPKGSVSFNSKKAGIMKALASGEFPQSVANKFKVKLATVEQYDRERLRSNKASTKPSRRRK